MTTYLCEKCFETVVVRDEISKYYLTEQRILYSHMELDGWLIGR